VKHPIVKHTPQWRAALKREIRALYHAATPATKQRGRAWYPAARNLAVAISERYAYSTESVAGAIAWLSPGVRWASNIADAYDLARDISKKTATTYSSNVEKARDSLLIGYPTFTPTSHKVGAFYSNIMNPDTSERVTVDRWILRSHGLREAVSAKQYETIARCYRETARELGESPSALQAIVWLHTRGEAPGEDSAIDAAISEIQSETESRPWEV
jgi:hypothetical protein